MRRCRGRHTGCPAPPSRIPACDLPAPGSSSEHAVYRSQEGFPGLIRHAYDLWLPVLVSLACSPLYPLPDVSSGYGLRWTNPTPDLASGRSSGRRTPPPVWPSELVRRDPTQGLPGPRLRLRRVPRSETRESFQDHHHTAESAEERGIRTRPASSPRPSPPSGVRRRGRKAPPSGISRRDGSGVGQTSGLTVHGASGSVVLGRGKLRARGPANRPTGGLTHASAGAVT